MKNLLRLILVLSVASLAGCHSRPASREDRYRHIDSLNERAYDWHYRHVDSVRCWASSALAEARRHHDIDGEAEALNNLAFERFQQMDFDSVLLLARQVEALSPALPEQLVASVMQMKVAQRTSDNLAFFRHRSHALKYMERLSRQEKRMTPHEHRRFAYGCSEAHIVASTYFYYLDQQERAIAEIMAAEPYCQMPEDTAQWLNYCYMRGSGGLSEQQDMSAVTQEEFGYLLKCFWLARYEGYRFFEANAEQSLATLFDDTTRVAVVRRQSAEQWTLLTTLFGTEHTARQMAEAALNTFVEYDDLYQEACVLRTLGELLFNAGQYEDAIDSYSKALACVNLHHLLYYAPEDVLHPSSNRNLLQPFDAHAGGESVERRWMLSPEVKTVPEWIAGIRQQLSVAYSAMDRKQESDYNRNIYLDLLDVTREDAELESRVAELKTKSIHIRWMVVALFVVAIIVGLFTWLLIRTYRRRTETQKRFLRQRFQQVEKHAREQSDALDEEKELLREQQAATELRLLHNKQRNIEKRAKLQLVYAIVPFLDRIIHEVHRMEQHGETSEASLTYIAELTERIMEYNALLTEWIQMEQGQLSLQLTSFSLEPLFESIRKSHYAYDQKGLRLNVLTTGLSVKADRALTLFMLNTLADNARKFTPAGGSVTISARSGEGDDGRFVELSVQDTGIGISSADIDLILNHKVYDAGAIGSLTGETALSHQWNSVVSPVRQSDTYNRAGDNGQKGFGFGLLNCKGIIEKYRKTAPLFRVCQLGIESRVGEGSRFWFRLPRVTTVAMVLLSCSLAAARGQGKAYALADSVYVCNVEGRYAETLKFAKAALQVISDNHVSHHSQPTERLTLYDTGGEPADIQWWRHEEQTDYSLLLGIRNEVAVAALALHEWPLYRYNNRIYTQLYKLTNQDTTLEAFCLQTERSQQWQRWALVLIVVVLLFGIMATYLFYFRPRIRFRRATADLSARRLQQLKRSSEAAHERQQEDFEMAEDEHRRRLYEEGRLHVQNQIIDNCLSVIKHETMYYPGRIQQLVQRGGDLKTLSETVAYYKEIYTLLSAQAAQQSEAVNFRRRQLEAKELLGPIEQHFPALARRQKLDVRLHVEDQLHASLFRGDPDLLSMLLEALFNAELALITQHAQHHEAQHVLTLTASAGGRFARFTCYNPDVLLTKEQLHQLFMPHEGGIPLLICKQVIREHDTFLGHPGCRIIAEAVGEGHAVWFTLPLQEVKIES